MDVCQVDQLRSERLAYRLFAQADAQYAFGGGVPADQREQDARFFGNAGTRRKQDLVEPIYLLQGDPVVAVDFYVRARFLQNVQ